jgi:hypothetical protein
MSLLFEALPEKAVLQKWIHKIRMALLTCMKNADFDQ